MFPSVDLIALTVRKPLKALCLGHRVLQKPLRKFSDPCSKLLKACWASGYIKLSIIGSSAVQAFGTEEENGFHFWLTECLAWISLLFVYGHSFLHLGFEMRRCCRIYTLSVNKYFVKFEIDIWHKKNKNNLKPQTNNLNPQNLVCGWNGKTT